MEEITVRPKYARQNLPVKRRRKNVKEQSSFIDGIMRQLAIAIIILLLVGIVKSVDTPTTAYLNNQIKSILFQDINLNDIYTNISDFINSMV